MGFDIAMHEEPHRTRVAVRGRITLGQLASLLQVLQVDSKDWRHDDVLLDLDGIEGRFLPAEKDLLGQVARFRLQGRRVTLRWPGDA